MLSGAIIRRSVHHLHFISLCLHFNRTLWRKSQTHVTSDRRPNNGERVLVLESTDTMVSSESSARQIELTAVVAIAWSNRTRFCRLAIPSAATCSYSPDCIALHVRDHSRSSQGQLCGNKLILVAFVLCYSYVSANLSDRCCVNCLRFVREVTCLNASSRYCNCHIRFHPIGVLLCKLRCSASYLSSTMCN